MLELLSDQNIPCRLMTWKLFLQPTITLFFCSLHDFLQPAEYKVEPLQQNLLSQCSEAMCKLHSDEECTFLSETTFSVNPVVTSAYKLFHNQHFISTFDYCFSAIRSSSNSKRKTAIYHSSRFISTEIMKFTLELKH